MTNCFILAKHRLVYMVSITSGEPVVCVWAKSASLENKNTVNCLQVTSAWIAYRVNEMRFNLFFFFLFFFLFDKTSIIFNSKYKHSIKTGRFYTSCILFITQKFKGVLNKRNKSCWNLCEGGNSPGSLPWHLALNQQQRGGGKPWCKLRELVKFQSCQCPKKRSPNRRHRLENQMITVIRVIGFLSRKVTAWLTVDKLVTLVKIYWYLVVVEDPGSSCLSLLRLLFYWFFF